MAFRAVTHYYMDQARFLLQNHVELDAYTVNNGVNLQALGLRIRIARTVVGPPQQFEIQRQDGGYWNTVIDANGWKFIVDAVDKMEIHNHYSEHTYRNVKNNLLFKEIYNIKQRDLKYERYNDMMGVWEEYTQNQESFVCVECGVIMPVGSLQVDHQRPKAQDNYEAMVKAMRIFGLTENGPKGPKGQIIANLNNWQLYTSSVNGQLPVRARFGATRLNNGTTLNQRYALNNFGITLVSLARAHGSLDAVKTAYIHSLYNLRPLCAACNVGRNTQPQTKF